MIFQFQLDFALKILSVCCEWILKYMPHEIKTLIQCCEETFRISWLGTELRDSTFPRLPLFLLAEMGVQDTAESFRVLLWLLHGLDLREDRHLVLVELQLHKMAPCRRCSPGDVFKLLPVQGGDLLPCGECFLLLLTFSYLPFLKVLEITYLYKNY